MWYNSWWWAIFKEILCATKQQTKPQTCQYKYSLSQLMTFVFLSLYEWCCSCFGISFTNSNVGSLYTIESLYCLIIYESSACKKNLCFLTFLRLSNVKKSKTPKRWSVSSNGPLAYIMSSKTEHFELAYNNISLHDFVHKTWTCFVKPIDIF